MVAKQGQYVQVGIFAGKNISFNLDKLCYGEINLAGTFSQKHSAWKRALDLLRCGKIRVSPIIGPTLPLCDWEKGFRMMETREAIKVLFEPKF
jgi:L-iditol 2-dehydrogenase